MICIGVTGGIGSGKSTVCALFEKKSVPIFYADKVANDISETSAFQEISDEFGEMIVDRKGALDRKRLAEIVFHDRGAMEKLNSIIHPRVFEEFHRWKKQDLGTARYGLIEAAVLFESGMFELMDYVLAIIANDEIRIRRVIDRDKTTDEQVMARIKNQISLEELLELSDFQLSNSGTLSETGAKVDFFHILFSTLKTPKEIE